MYRRVNVADTCISLKSAPPTPTIRIDKGKSDALTKASLVSWKSLITPSWNYYIVSKEDKQDPDDKIQKKKKKRKTQKETKYSATYRNYKQDEVLIPPVI